MADFQALITKENIKRNRFMKFIENGKKTPLIRRTQGFFESKICELRTLWHEYVELDDAIQEELAQLGQEDLTENYETEDKIGKVEIKYSDYLAELYEGQRLLVAETAAVDTSVMQPPISIQHDVSLPRINNPKHNGEYDVEKLYHLKSCLIGDAEKLLRHIPITNEDYEPAWNKLKDRYENKKIIVNHQLKILVNQPKVPIEKPKGLKGLIDTTSECLQQLTSLGVDTNSWDTLLVYILVQKLPYMTLRLWEEEQGNKQELPKYKTFHEFLTTRLRIIESIADAVTPNLSVQKQSNRDITVAHHTTTQNKCILCNDNHFVQKCPKYQRLTILERIKVIKTAGRCLNCKTKVEEEFLVLKSITEPLPPKIITQSDYPFLHGLKLADPLFWKPGKIDALLGAGLYAKIIKNGIRRGSKADPIAITTLFGWILLGPTENKCSSNVSTFTATIQDCEIDKQLKKFWDIEEIPVQTMLSKQEKDCQDWYNKTVIRLQDGTYQVQLPFHNLQPPRLGESRPQALKRYFCLQKQLSAKPEMQQEYNKCIEEYINLGHARPVDVPNENEEHYYLPHNAVIKDSITTKLRVVFDASAKTSNGTSLNDRLMKGPTLQPKLFATLLNWRKYRIAMNAGIEKMYRMIAIHPNHRKYQRIIWHTKDNKKVQDYELNTVTFGTTSAPYLAIRTIQQLAEEEKNKWPEASEVLKREFYVDDLLSGADNVEDAKTLQLQLINMLQSGGFKLRKWTSNEPRLIEHLPKEYQDPRTNLIFDEHESIKTLGICWHPASDQFSFVVNLKKNQGTSTKRIVLSEIASLYDPLGWLAPIIIIAKILMQQIWITGCSWDKPLPKHIEEQWEHFKNELPQIHVNIPRWVSYSPQAQISLHGFCDASEKAYAAVTYLRVVSNAGEITCRLLTSKTRVAPTKPITIPRLEHNGAVLLAKLMKTTITDMQLGNVPIYAWTDSTIVLQWIREHPSRWKTYVAHRVVEIQDNIRYDHWRHVPTKSNPADLASRGINPAQIISQELWWSGPEWLRKDTNCWPNDHINKERTTLEAKVLNTTNLMVQSDDSILYKYSCYTQLIRITAQVKRFIYNCKNPESKKRTILSIEELNEAEKCICQTVQRTMFMETYDQLRDKKNPHQKEVDY